MNRASVLYVAEHKPDDCRRGELLSRHTTFRVGGRADIFHAPGSIEGLVGAVELCRHLGLRSLVLGGGSNLLFSDRGFRGVILSTRNLDAMTETSNGWRVEAGTPLSRVVSVAEARGTHALSFLVGIPGTVGGAAVMNAGIRGTSIASVLERVEILDRTGGVRTLTSAECGFRYRGSRMLEKGETVLAVHVRADGPAFDGRAMLARKQATQPLSLPSAGCVFKNPEGHAAGALIENSGLKGYRVGDAMISEKHANFIVNLGGASSAEICKLIDIVRQKVYNTFHVRLDLEIGVIDG
ncbi:MAG: UDP-N-acetylmuramate dehydrogenase [Candidatus Bipolaricaulota bacterium]